MDEGAGVAIIFAGVIIGILSFAGHNIRNYGSK
jgi:hypothetical protein